jgi:hypothetical protein
MMEVRCPNCQQRLRYPDHLVKPLLRCRNCLTTFRPADAQSPIEAPVSAVAVEEFDPEINEEFRSFTEKSERELAEASTTRKSGKSGVGYFIVIALVIALKVGPRLAREFFRERKPERPVQLQQDEQQAIQKVLQEAAENAKKGPDLRMPPVPMPNRDVPRN